MTNPDENPAPQRRRFTAPLFLAGAIALVTSLFFVTGNPASAQAGVAVAPVAADAEPTDPEPAEIDDDQEAPELNEDELDAAIAEYEQCLTDNGADLDALLELEDLDAEDLDELVGNDLDNEDVEEDEKDLDDEDDDLDELVGDDEVGVMVWSLDGVSDAEFGAGDATVSITKTDAGVAVTSTGDVTITEWSIEDDGDMDDDREDLAWAEYDEALETCDPIIDALELDFLDDDNDEDEDVKRCSWATRF